MTTITKKSRLEIAEMIENEKQSIISKGYKGTDKAALWFAVRDLAFEDKQIFWYLRNWFGCISAVDMTQGQCVQLIKILRSEVK